MRNLDTLTRYAKYFSGPDFHAGDVRGGEPDATGSLQFPYVVPTEIAMKFVEDLYDDNWIMGDFSWPEWAGTDRARELLDDKNALATADATELGRVLTVIVRQDRFSTGTLLSAFESGYMLAVVKRAETLKSEAARSRAKAKKSAEQSGA